MLTAEASLPWSHGHGIRLLGKRLIAPSLAGFWRLRVFRLLVAHLWWWVWMSRGCVKLKLRKDPGWT